MVLLQAPPRPARVALPYPASQMTGVTLQRRGFRVPLDTVANRANFEALQNTVLIRTYPQRAPMGRGRFRGAPPPPDQLHCYRWEDEAHTAVLLPRFVVLACTDAAQIPLRNEAWPGAKMREGLRFSAARSLHESVRRPQVSAAKYAVDNLRATGGCVLVLPVGTGKTTIGLYVAVEIGERALICVQNTELADQWTERIREFVPGAVIGRIQGDECTVDGCDFVIATLQSLSQRDDYPAEKLDKFGIVLLDECHHVAAKTFLDAVWKVACPRMLALSADPTRSDNMTDILYYMCSWNVFVVRPTLPDGITLNVFTHTLTHRCPIDDHDALGDNERRRRKRLRPHERDWDATLADDRAHPLDIICQMNKDEPQSPPPIAPAAATDDDDGGGSDDFESGPPPSRVSAPRNGNANEFGRTDPFSDKGYVFVYSGVAAQANRNALIVAYIRQLLVTTDVGQVHCPTNEECRTTTPLTDTHPIVKVRVTRDGESVLVPVDELSLDETKRFEQVERQILLLTVHKAHIRSLHRRLVRSGIPDAMIGEYVGGLTSEQRHAALRCRVILGTFEMASEGLDLPSLNTIILATPRGRTLQPVGRALRDRLTPSLQPVVIDFYDEFVKMCGGLYWNRMRDFKAYGRQTRVTKFTDTRTLSIVGPYCTRPMDNAAHRQETSSRETDKTARAAAKQEQQAARQAEKQARKEALAAEKRAQKEALVAEKAAARASKRSTSGGDKAEGKPAKKQKKAGAGSANQSP